MQRGEGLQGNGQRTISAGPEVKQETNNLLTKANLHIRQGCSSVLDSLVITPFERLAACCGLPREEIPELDLGSLHGQNLSVLYDNGRNDFIKIWLAVEGPEKILAWTANFDPTIEWEGRYSHQCESCRAVFKDPKVKKVILKHYQEKLPEIILRFAAIQNSSNLSLSSQERDEHLQKKPTKIRKANSYEKHNKYSSRVNRPLSSK